MIADFIAFISHRTWQRERHDAQLKEDQERKKSEAEAQNLILNR